VNKGCTFECLLVSPLPSVSHVDRTLTLLARVPYLTFHLTEALVCLIEPVCKQLICTLQDGVSQSDCIIDRIANCRYKFRLKRFE
jgi:hypothetical protein